MNKFEDFIYKLLFKWYVKLSNKRHYNFVHIKSDDTVTINEKYDGVNLSVLNPVEVVYFCLNKVYRNNITKLGICGFNINICNTEAQIDVTFRLRRPGIMIGKYGEGIDKFREALEKYFNKKVQINLEDVKNDILMY